MINEFGDGVLDMFKNSEPFNHVVIDNFFEESVANNIASEYPSVSTDKGVFYNNPIEVKKAIGDWNQFPKNTYSAFQYMCSQDFLNKLEKITGIQGLIADYGLHGGGYHMHPRGGKLNVHKDYSIHPKLGLERRINIIVYLTPDWQESWGGGLQLWTHDEEHNLPKEMAKQVHNQFNRAIIFDTTQNSWHGLPDKIQCPEGMSRNSLAIYYLSEPRQRIETHSRALFAPHKDQSKDEEVLDFIRKRSIVPKN